jgi:uncharacterized membrane protein YhaH (DUF805 family)
MRHALDLFSWEGRVSRKGYLLAGLLLFALKYPIDLLISMAFHQEWNPLMYLSPRVSPLGHNIDRTYLIALVVAAAPFMYMGLSLTVRRLRDMGVSPFWAGLFFLPFLHFAFFAVLVFAPPKQDAEALALPATGPYREHVPPATPPPPKFLARVIPRSKGMAYLFGLVLSLIMGLGCYVIAAQVNQALGSMLFVGLPFGMGFFTAFTTSYHRQLKARTAIWYGTSALVVASLLLLAVAWEGIACIVMAFPILFGMMALGAWVGWLCAGSKTYQALAPLLLLLIPGLVGMDIVRPHAPEPLSVVSTVKVNAPPEVVWKNVISFPPISSAPSPIFAIVAMPIEARIEGHDPGATRRCVFTNGTFVEPIEVWNEPRELTFGVREQPGKLDEYLNVKRGRFLLTANPDGTTTLEGTTWYELKVFPVAYWRAWAGTFLHAIHLRVLDHVKRLSEQPLARAAAEPPPMPSWMAASNATCACTRHATR